MKNLFAFRNVILLFSVMLVWRTPYAQCPDITFETLIIGEPDGSEELVDVKALYCGPSVILGNTSSAYGPQKIILTELTYDGEVVWFRTIQDGVNTDIEFTGKSLELAYNDNGSHNGYYITGCMGNYHSQMVVIKTDLNGSPLWTRVLYNTERHDTLEECGVSLELQSNGDIIAVGTSANYNTGNNRFIVARLRPNGNLVWCNRYGSGQGIKFYPNESCNGMRSGVPVITVVGHVEEDGLNHTFLSCIRAGTGVELWRRRYESNGSRDEGNDVVQNPFNQRFMVVGQIDTVGGYSEMWVFNVNVLNGTLTDGTAYRHTDGNLVATDVCLGAPLSSALIVGRRDSTVYRGPHTFAMRLPFSAGAAPVWNYYYENSAPNVLLDDAVDKDIWASPENFIVGSDYEDGFYVAKIPSVGDEICSGIPFGVTSSPVGQSETLNRQRAASDDWSQYSLTAIDEGYVYSPCIPSSAEFAPEGTLEFNVQPDVSVFPNPIYAGDLIHIQGDLPEDAEVDIQLLDANNRSYGNWREYRDAGMQSFAMKMPEEAYMKFYFVKITLSSGQQKIIPLVANL